MAYALQSCRTCKHWKLRCGCIQKDILLSIGNAKIKAAIIYPQWQNNACLYREEKEGKCVR